MTEFLGDLFAPLFGLLTEALMAFHGWGAPWWLSIVMLTIIVRGLLFPLTVKQVRGMQKMQELKPDLEKIKGRFQNNQQKQREAIAELYRERKLNPAAGCLPMFVQLPIFIALYHAIRRLDHLESFKTGGLLWFHDLTAADPYFVLPILYVLTMIAAQEVAARHTPPGQRNLMRLLPVVFGVFLSQFPAALLVYWVANNIITFLQNLLIYTFSSGSGKAVPEPGGAPAGK